MTGNTKAFRVGEALESDTAYFAEQREYHIWPRDARSPGFCWYTTVTPQDPPLLAAFVLRDLENVTVDLGGAKLVFHGRVMPFALYNCKNVTLKNFSIDYDRPFFTQGAVTDVDAGSGTLDIPETFRFRVEQSELIAEGDGWERSLNFGAPLFQPYDARTMRLSPKTPMMLAVVGERVIPQENPPCPIYQLRAERLAGRRVRLTGVPSFFRPDVGEIVAFTHENRHKTGFQLEDCADVTLANIRLLHISAMAVIANLCHNLTFRNFSCYADEQMGERIIAVNADVLHGFHCTGRVLAEDCRFENMLDDALNFHGNYAVCEAKTDARGLIAVNRSAAQSFIPLYRPGDTVFVYRGKTQEFKAAYTLASAEYLPGDGRRLALSTREPLNDFAPGDIIENRRMPEITVRRCQAGRARGGWRISSGRRVVMEDCRFENTPVMFTGDTNYWYENSPVRDVEIRNCVFENFRNFTPITSTPVFDATDAAPFYHSGIRIIGNRFVGCEGTLMHLERTRDVVFRDNVNRAGNTQTDDITLRRCAGVTIG